MGFKLTAPTAARARTTSSGSAASCGRTTPECSAEDDYRNTWLRANVAGPQRERWFHYAGCRLWLTAERDTTDNALRVEDS